MGETESPRDIEPEEDTIEPYLPDDAGINRACEDNELGTRGLKIVIESLENGVPIDYPGIRKSLSEKFADWKLEDFRRLDKLLKEKIEKKWKAKKLEEVLFSLRLPPTATKEEVLAAVEKLF